MLGFDFDWKLQRNEYSAVKIRKLNFQTTLSISSEFQWLQNEKRDVFEKRHWNPESGIFDTFRRGAFVRTTKKKVARQDFQSGEYKYGSRQLPFLFICLNDPGESLSARVSAARQN